MTGSARRWHVSARDFKTFVSNFSQPPLDVLLNWNRGRAIDLLPVSDKACTFVLVVFFCQLNLHPRNSLSNCFVVLSDTLILLTEGEGESESSEVSCGDGA